MPASHPYTESRVTKANSQVSKIKAIQFVTLPQIKLLAFIWRQPCQFSCIQEWWQHNGNIFSQLKNCLEQYIRWRLSVGLKETICVIRAGYGPVRIQECCIKGRKPRQKALVEYIAGNKCHGAQKAGLLQVLLCLGLVIWINLHGYHLGCCSSQSDGREPGTCTRLKDSAPTEPLCHMRGESLINAHHERAFICYVVVPKLLPYRIWIHT